MKYMQNYLSVAHAVAEPEGRHAGLLAEDAAQVRGVVVMETLGYLLYGQVGGVEQVLDHQPDLYVDLFLGSGAEIFTVDDVQVIGGDVEPVGIIGHVVMPGVMPAQHGDEVVGQHPRPVLGGIVAKLPQPPFYLIGMMCIRFSVSLCMVSKRIGSEQFASIHSSIVNQLDTIPRRGYGTGKTVDLNTNSQKRLDVIR